MNRLSAEEAGRLDGRFSVAMCHQVRFTRHVEDPANPLLDELLRTELRTAEGRRPNGLLIIDEGLHAAQRAFADRLIRRLASSGVAMVDAPHIAPSGEAAKKGLRAVEPMLQAIDEAHLCRRSYLFVAGGGAVLDAAGFAAAIAHRGVRIVRFPSTTLAQDDAGIGVKNGLNFLGKKNFVGTFDPPFAVVNDLELLRTLPDRHFRAGLSEAVKVALLKDSAFFLEIESSAQHLTARNPVVTERVVSRCAELHFLHIVQGGDPFERHRARPLDFGHWAAHRIESMTNFSVLHGEAVAIGIALDCRYAVRAGLLSEEDAGRVVQVLESLGFTLNHPCLRDHREIVRGIEEFREHLGGLLSITMLRGIGESVEVHEIDSELMRRAIGDLAGRTGPTDLEARAG